MKLIFLVLFTSISSLFVDDNKELAQTYINSYKHIAVQEMERTGIPASIKLAQGLLESDWGRSDLAQTANNHFGIKCGSRWNGRTFFKSDDDRNSKGELIESCFRSFASPVESYMAHSDFLTDPRKEYRYGFLFDYDSSDYKAWAKGLKKSGYATDPKYPDKLIMIIEKYNLDQFDAMNRGAIIANSKENQLNKEEITIAREADKSVTVSHEALSGDLASSTPINKKEVAQKEDYKTIATRMPAKHVSRLAYDIEILNKCRKVTSKGGETLGELARAIGISAEELILHNEIYEREDEVLEVSKNIYLEKKKRSFRGDYEFHMVMEGETMESIAQLYGIRVKSLYAKNRMPKNSKTIPGVKLFLSRSAGLDERPKFITTDSNRKHRFLFEES